MYSRGRDDDLGAAHADQPAPLPGVIDTIGVGYAALAARPLVILPLVLLDLYLLFGPRLLLAPLTRELESVATRQAGDLEMALRDIQRLENSNIFEVVALGAPLVRTPVIAPTFPAERFADLDIGLTFAGAPGWFLFALVPVTLLLAFIFASSFRILLAASGLGIGELRDSLRPRIVGRLALATAGWVLLMTGLAALVAMPALVATLVGAILGVPGVGLIWIAMLIPAVWAFVHFFFSIPALFVDRRGTFAAVKGSYQVVRRHFWESLRFIGVSLLISTGLTAALHGLAGSHPGAVAAIVINAFLASGMIVAAMLFYRDRARRLGLPGYVSER